MARSIIAGAFVSLDGVMQAPGGPEEDPTGGFEHGGWTATYWDELMGERMGALFDRPFELLLGRKTYEIFAAHWPFVEDEPIAEVFNRTAKHVVTSSKEPLAWANSHAVSGDISAEIAKLKRQDGPDLLIQGSSQLYPTLLQAGLIDRIFLLIFPVVLGNGKRLFGAGVPPAGLRLLDNAVSTTGVLLATYEPAGAVPLGSFALDEPSEAELARRERMKAEG